MDLEKEFIFHSEDFFKNILGIDENENFLENDDQEKIQSKETETEHLTTSSDKVWKQNSEVKFCFIDLDVDIEIKQIEKKVMKLFVRKILNFNGYSTIKEKDVNEEEKKLILDEDKGNVNFFKREDLWGKILYENFDIKFIEDSYGADIKISFQKDIIKK